jgi:hypothetical protein
MLTLEVSCLRCREDPLPQTPYVVLHSAPVDRRPVADLVLRSVHHNVRARGRLRRLRHICRHGVQLVLRFRCLSSRASQAHQIHVSTLSGRGIDPYPASYAEAADGGVGTAASVSCFLSAAGVGFLDLPAPAEELGLPCGRLTRRYRLDLIGVVAFRMSEIRTGWVSSGPRGRWCAPDRRALPVGTCRLPATGPYHPFELPIDGRLLDEASSRIHPHSPGRPSPACGPRMERGPLGRYPRLRTPRLPAAHAGAGTGHAHWPGPTPSTSVEPPRCRTTQLKRPRVASARSNSA